MSWETVIGLEVHLQLATRSKLFSGAATAFGAAPNTQACAIDLALPGTLPLLNKAAVEMAIRFGLAVDAAINPVSVFERKNYFYPDLPKGYQTTQLAHPIVGRAISTSSSPTGAKSASAFTTPTWKKMPASRCTRTSTACRASTSTAPARR